MPKLTDTQLAILSTAAKRDNGAVLPVSKRLNANKGAIASCVKSLIRRGLVAELSATGDAAIWREAKDGTRFALAITDTGLNAIGIDPDEAQDNPIAGRVRTAKKPAAATPNRSGTKRTLMLDLLHRPDGASIAELSTALGWQAHSVRGAISGTIKKQLGFAVISEQADGRGRVYRIIADELAT